MKNLLAYDGELYLIKGFYSSAVARQLFDSLLQDLAWQEEQIHIFGRWLKVPRLMCWYADKGINYKYSGVNHLPLPWAGQLLAIKQDIESCCRISFNSVLANLYRSGSDSVGSHADDEKELGINPFIASLSLGEERLLKFRHNKSKEVLNVILSNGDLLLMAGEIQHHWQHELPKTKKKKTQRINLTFRQIFQKKTNYK